MNEKVSLGRNLKSERAWAWQTPEWRREHQSIVVTRTWSQWRSKRGFKIHRARYARIHRRDGSITLEWLCGNICHNPIPFREECAEGLVPCDRCEVVYAKKAVAS